MSFSSQHLVATGILLLLLLQPAQAAAGQPETATTHGGFPSCGADQELLQELLAAAEVERRPPRPSPTLYVQDLATALLSWLLGHLPRGTGLASTLVFIGRGLAISLPIIALAAVLMVQLRLLRRRRRLQPAADNDSSGTGHTDAPTTTRDPATCWQEMEQALAGDRAAVALTALWWWLALVVAGTGADPTWTTRQLLAAARRSLPSSSTVTRLGQLCVRFDTLSYGPGARSAAQVRHLAEQLREALA